MWVCLIKKMLLFLGEKFDPEHYKDIHTEPKQHDHNKLFSEEEIVQIKRLCQRWGEHYGYFEAVAPNTQKNIQKLRA